MPSCLSTVTYLPFIWRSGHLRPSSLTRRTSIHILNDDSLLNIFVHCRPAPLGDDKPDDSGILQRTDPDRERWWYKLAQVCRKWRFLAFASPSRLGICLICTYGTPVVEMLAHSPSLPLAIDYVDQDREIAQEDEEGILFALQRRRRIRRIRLCIPVSNFPKVVLAINGEFPMLEYLYIKSLAENESATLPATFQAPHLRRLVLRNVAHSSSMSRHDHPLPALRVQSSEGSGLYPRCSGSQLIHVLDNDSLLNIFHHYQPVPFDKDEPDDSSVLWMEPDRERWWYKLAHVCRRWRFLVFASASHLGICLVCTYGTPVEEMLTHSPPLPLAIDYIGGDLKITPEDEEGILLVLVYYRLRVRHIRLCIPNSNLQIVILAMVGEFPMLEHLYIKHLADDNRSLMLPETFQAPHLRHIVSGNLTYLHGNSHHDFLPVMPPLSPQSIESLRSSSWSLSDPWGLHSSGREHSRFQKLFLPVLDDDSLLNIFDFCRPGILDEDGTDEKHILQGGNWARERWWYKFAQVCRRWRYLILGSASRLGLCLLCARGTPVKDMLANSPPLPLVIDHLNNYPDITTKDEEWILFALQHHDRVRRIRLAVPIPYLRRFIAAMGKEFPILEYLFIDPLIYNNIGFALPETFQAPRLRHIVLLNRAFMMGSTLLATLEGLVTLSLNYIPPSQLSPNDLLQQVSLMPHLRTLQIHFYCPAPRRDVERQDLVMPIITPVTLPNLRWFGFKGVSAYLEALLPRIRAPLLEKLQITFFNQLSFSIPNLQQFIGGAENLRFISANLRFDEDGVNLEVYPRKETQVSSAAQVISVLGPLFSSIVDLTLGYEVHMLSSEWHTDADRTQWREVLRSFNNVKTLHVPNDLVKELSGPLRMHDGDSPMELLPELEELRYDAGGHIQVSDAFVPFLDERRNAGRPITLVPILIPGIRQPYGFRRLPRVRSRADYIPAPYSPASWGPPGQVQPGEDHTRPLYPIMPGPWADTWQMQPGAEYTPASPTYSIVELEVPSPPRTSLGRDHPGQAFES